MRLQRPGASQAKEQLLHVTMIRSMKTPLSPFWHVVGILGCTQIISWGSLYYAFSVVAPDIGRDLGLREELLYGAFSWSLLVAGMVATPVGAVLDRHGGRWVMSGGSVTCGLGLIWLSQCAGAVSYIAAWTLLGLAMSLTLYEAAFATISRKFSEGSLQAISTLTLFGGFASTVFWPLM